MTERLRNRSPVPLLYSVLSAQGVLSVTGVGRQFRRKTQHNGYLSTDRKAYRGRCHLFNGGSEAGECIHDEIFEIVRSSLSEVENKN